MGADAPDALEQLGREAAELEQDTREQGAPPPGGQADAKQAAPDGNNDGAAGGAPDDGEFIENPAPYLAWAITTACKLPMLRDRLPAALVAALDPATVHELADALGAVAVKYRITMNAATFGRWKEEARLALALLAVAGRVMQAAPADAEGARAARARDVSPGAGGEPVYADPPNPAAGEKPVEPGA